MANRDPEHEARVERKRKQLRVVFSDYQAAVTLISSVEAWLEHEWGAVGRTEPNRLTRFDRFPVLAIHGAGASGEGPSVERNLTPDFMAYFVTPYVLCGEHKKTFRTGRAARDDVQQVAAYSQWRPPADGEGREPGYDVLLLVSMESDEAAVAEIARAAASEDVASTPGAPIVVTGFFKDAERSTGEWYTLKWRGIAGNSRFTEPNVTSTPGQRDLNSLLTRQQHLAIRVDKPALDLSGRNPLINDEPPPAYTVAFIIVPALNNLLTEDDRDALRQTGKVIKTLSRCDILSAPVLRSVNPPEGYIQKALDWLVSRGLARESSDGGPSTYEISIERETLKKDLCDYLTEKEARAILREVKLRQQRRSRRHREPRGQGTLTFPETS